MATDFGTCISVTDDLPLKWRYVRGQRVVAEAVFRRWNTERGSLPYALDYGTDAAGAIGETFTPATASALEAALEREAEKDERVLAATVSTSYDFASSKLTITGAITTADGVFNLVVSVDSLTAELLRVT